MDQPIRDLHTVYEELSKARTKWYNIGLALGVDNETLTAIGREHREKDEECLRDLLARCLQMSSLTWRKLCEVLEGTTVQRKNVADEIRQKFKVSTSSISEPQMTSESEETSRKRKRLDSDTKLKNDLKSIQKKHAKLMSSTRKSLKKKQVEPKDIAAHLLGFQDSRPVRMTDDSSLLLAHRLDQLWAAETVDDIFKEINPFESFLDYDLLEIIIDQFGDDEDQSNLEHYIEALKEFLCLWKVTEPHNIHENVSISEDEIKMWFKLDSDSLKCYREIKGSIARIFEVDPYVIRIVTVDFGCIKIGFLFPKTVVERSIPLNASQKARLAALSPPVLSVEVVTDGNTDNMIFEQVVNDDSPSEELHSKRPRVSDDVFTVSDIPQRLLAACRSKTPDIYEIRGYLEHKECDVNIRDDEFKWTPFMWCLENKHFVIAKLLLKYQPSVHIQDKKEWSPLVLASRAGDLEIVQGIVELGAEIDKPTNKLWTPLMWAAQEGHARVAEFLLKSGAFVDFPDENGWTPLMQASQEGHVDVVNVLLDHGANANHQTDTFWCALMAAAKNKHSEVVDALLRKGAEVDLARDDGSTALQVASYYKGNSAVVNVLIKNRATLDLQNKDGMTALMLATNKGHLDLVQALLNGGADINKKQPSTEWPAIFFAARIGNPDVFKELLHRGADTEISHERTVAKIADYFKHKAILSELNKYKATHKQQISSHLPTSTPVKQADQEHKTSAPESNSKTRHKQQPLVQQPADSKWITEDEENIKHMFEEFIFGLLKATSRGPRKGLPSAEEFSYKGDLYREQLQCS